MNRIYHIFVHLALPALLAGALLVPSALQLSHVLGDHEHKECEEVSTHLHERKIDCDIALFHFSQFYDDGPVTFEPLSKTINGTKEFPYFLELYSQETHSLYLRGPPEVAFA